MTDTFSTVSHRTDGCRFRTEFPDTSYRHCWWSRHISGTVAVRARRDAWVRWATPTLMIVVSLVALTGCIGANWPVSPLSPASLRPDPSAPESATARHDPRMQDYPVAGDLQVVLAQVDLVSSALRAADAEARARGEEVGVATSQYWGELTPFASTEHLDAPRLVNPLSPPIQINSIPFDDNQYHLGVRAVVPIDLSGRIGAEVRGAEASYRASRADSEDLRLRLLHTAARLYRGLQGLSGTRIALETERDALLGHIRTAKEAVRVGRMARVEELRLQAELDTVLGEIAGLDGQEAGLRSSLTALMRVDDYRSAVESAPPSPPPLAEVRGLWNQRPDLLAARSRVDSSAEEARAAAARRLPEVGVEGQVVYNAGYAEGGDPIGQVGVFVEWPIFDGGRRESAQRAARARYGASLQRLQEIEDRARAEVVAAAAAWHAAERRHAAALSSAVAAKETTQIQTRRFAEGRLSAADLLDAQAAQSRSEAEVAASKAEWWAADDAVQRALGRPPAGYLGIRTPMENRDEH